MVLLISQFLIKIIFKTISDSIRILKEINIGTVERGNLIPKREKIVFKKIPMKIKIEIDKPTDNKKILVVSIFDILNSFKIKYPGISVKNTKPKI
ncbi:hypothetical protein [Methanospirillum lacunae]|uniref:hypothetical protein n=1 Tax=Methanospirillum lacunae TaxID=668570 RepID=UPI0015E844DE|nr:hypothetical protein [Methanospirillum lacunae]